MVKKRKAIVSWDRAAFLSLQRAFEYISKDSASNAEKVRDSILKIIRGFPIIPSYEYDIFISYRHLPPLKLRQTGSDSISS